MRIMSIIIMLNKYDHNVRVLWYCRSIMYDYDNNVWILWFMVTLMKKYEDVIGQWRMLYDLIMIFEYDDVVKVW